MSSPPLRVFLTSEQERTLFELSKAPNVPQRIKDRSQALRLSTMGWKVERIAVYLKWAESTVRTAIHRWEKNGLMGLWDAPRSGRKRKWQPENIEEITEKIDKEQRTYNTRQLLEMLATLNGVYISERQLRRILKKKLLMEKNKELNKGETKASGTSPQARGFRYFRMGWCCGRNLLEIFR